MDAVPNMDFQLIVTVVNKGYALEVIEAGRKVGAEGGTILHGRGSGIHEQVKFFGVFIEPEKEIVLTLVDKRKVDGVLDAITKAVSLELPGHGIAFVVDVPKVVGIHHLTQSKEQAK